MQIRVIGLDIAKHVFQVHAVDADGRAATLYHYLHADGSLKEPGRKLLAS
jgi:hypothetical protein